MGTGYTRNDTVNNIADGNVINASDLDGEFDAVQAAFNESTGHTHDGTSAEGAPVTTVGPAQDVNVGTSAVTPKTDNTVDLGSNSLEFKDLYIDGTANIDALVADTADINAGTIDGTVIGGSTPAAATVTTLTVNGNTTLGDAATDTVTFTADVASNIIPSADNTHDLGASGSEWKDLYIDGTANIDSLVADTADINGGTIDGVTIGGAAPGVGTFTTANATTVDATNIEVTNIKAKDGSASATIADSTGVMTIASSVLTTADINGGTADNVVIGGATAAAGTFTTATATTGNITTVNATTVDTTNIEVTNIKAKDGTAAGSIADSTGIVTLTSVTGTTADYTNVEVTNIKAKDGTSAGSIADSTGVVTLASSVLTTTDINGGTIDNTAIGGSTAAAGSFTTLNTSGQVVFNDAGADVDFRVEGDTDANLLFVDASTDRVGIGTNTPDALLNVDGIASFGAGAAATPSIAAAGDLNTGVFFPAADNIGFTTGGTIRGRWTTDGLCFGSDTAAANALDDYEEGTWTATITTTGGSVTISTQTCTYTKVGRLVTIGGIISLSGISSPTGQLQITNLPFTPATSYQGGTVVYLQNSASTTATSIFAETDTSRIYIGKYTELDSVTDATDLLTATSLIKFGSFFPV